MLSIGKCPYRVSLLGGGSDLDWYLEKENEGFSLGYSLNKYSYAVVNQLDENSKQGILNYSIRENYKQLDDIVNPLIREALRKYGGKNFFEISTFGFALGGSGLGGSSSFLVALLAALQKSNKCKINNFDLALEAAKLEIFNIKKPIGYQDHFLSALGDINCLAFSKGSNVKKIELSNEKKIVLNRIINNLFLVSSFKTRSADKVLQNLQKCRSSIEDINQIKCIAYSFIKNSDKRDHVIEELLHSSIKDSWMIKKEMTSVLDTELKEQYKILDALIPNNWIRLLGAGSGGYFLICPKISSQETIDKLINSSFNKFLKAELSKEGVTTQIF